MRRPKDAASGRVRRRPTIMNIGRTDEGKADMVQRRRVRDHSEREPDEEGAEPDGARQDCPDRVELESFAIAQYSPRQSVSRRSPAHVEALSRL